jgi:hypothetical protein
LTIPGEHLSVISNTLRGDVGVISVRDEAAKVPNFIHGVATNASDKQSIAVCGYKSRMQGREGASFSRVPNKTAAITGAARC